MKKSKPNPLRVFEAHGVDFTGESGNQAIGFCPFSGKDDKFYVNKDNLLWDSKSAGVSGNVAQFLEMIAKQNADDIRPREIGRLQSDRGLPFAAFHFWGIGYDGKQYTIPVYGSKSGCVDIRNYRPGGKVRSTAGCSVGLLGGHKLTKRNTNTPVYVCEGDWDAIALSWLTRRIHKDILVVGSPGASVFKKEWVETFRNRTVYVAYDNDEAGELGELNVYKKLAKVVKTIRFIHWPDNLDSGFDVRDWVISVAIKRKTPKKCYNKLLKMARLSPRRGKQDDKEVVDTQEEELERPTEWDQQADFNDVTRVFDKWLYLDNHYAIEMVLASAISQKIQGDPLWLFIVGPPGGGKTEALTSLALHESSYMTSALTTHALISGATYKNGADPSLIPRLDGKVLIIKDFTAILSMRDSDRDEIFGILRDAYDGRCGKVFGTGTERSYKSRFTVLAAVTPRIYEMAQQHQSLGERFLKFFIGDNIHHHGEEDIIERAISNVNTDEEMKWELQDVVRSFLSYNYDEDEIPRIPVKYKKRIISLAKFCARLRGTVSRDRFRHDILVSRPSAEIGSRLGKQFAKLVISLAMVHRRMEINEHDYILVKKCALDTIPQRSEDVVRWLHEECETIDDTRTTADIAKATRYPMATVARMLADMHLLDIVSRTGKRNRHDWTLSKYIRDTIKVARMYTTHEELHRAKPIVEVTRVKKYKERKDKGKPRPNRRKKRDKED